MVIRKKNEKIKGKRKGQKFYTRKINKAQTSIIKWNLHIIE